MTQESIDQESLDMRAAKAIEWLFSTEAGPLKVCEARYIIRERFGPDVDKFLRDRFGKQ
jgi:hypothetical protein